MPKRCDHSLRLNLFRTILADFLCSKSNQKEEKEAKEVCPLSLILLGLLKDDGV